MQGKIEDSVKAFDKAIELKTRIPYLCNRGNAK
jgi:hypothetical protein